MLGYRPDVTVPGPSTAAILIIGDEILSGKFADENGPYAIKELRALGVDVRRLAVIPDDLNAIAGYIARWSQQYTYVFTSGGVGPTHDDRTIAGIAQGLGVPVVRNQKLLEMIHGYWGNNVAPAYLRLAEVPAGSELLLAQDGSKAWPAVRVQNIFVFPGVPSLFRRKFQMVANSLQGTPVTSARLYFTCDEGTLADILTAASEQFPEVAMGSYPRFEETTFRVIITLDSRNVQQLEKARDQLATQLADYLVVPTLASS